MNDPVANSAVRHTLADLHRHYFQTAYVVRDLAAAEGWFGRVLGVPQWTRFDVEVGAGCTFRGRPADSAMRVSLGYAGEVQIELIEPARGVSMYTEFLDAKGPGLHHIAFAVPDYDATVSALAAEGLEPIQQGVTPDGQVRFTYFDCDRYGASVIEILGFTPAMAAAMDAMKAAARAARD